MNRLAVLMALAGVLTSSAARSTVPGGPALPSTDNRLYAAAGDARLGYYLESNSYRFQGRYDITYNFARLGPALIYGLADVDVEIVSDHYRNFEPDRQTGTFEIGARHVGVGPLGLFLRHQSPHNIDRADRRQGSWEMVGARWSDHLDKTEFSVSAGRYISPVVFDYQWDLNLRAVRPMGQIIHKEWELMANVHYIRESGPRPGIADFWLEPDVSLTTHLKWFVGGGLVHDIDVFNGKTDHPIIAGIKIVW